MDIRLRDAAASAVERQAIDALLGAPGTAWDGGLRGALRDAFVAYGGRADRDRRHLLLPALQALQSAVGWISEGGLSYVCERLNVPPAEAWSVATFYALLATSPRPRKVLHVCQDLACRTRGAGDLCATLEATVGPPIGHAPERDHVELDPSRPAWMHSPCLGLCDVAPAALLTAAGPQPVERSIGHATPASLRALLDGDAVAEARVARAAAAHDAADDPPLPQRGDPSLVLLARVGVVDPTSLQAYRAAGGYVALRRALDMGPEAVIREVTESNLVGRGGAAFPTGRKWAAVRAQPATPRYLVCNADESEPGTFKDRVLLVGDPFAVIESMTIAAFAAGCERGFVYLRAEYPLAHERLANAVAQARAAGLLGADILGRGLSFDIELRRGAGAYICGEETALFESIEGRRGEPRSKPPFPAQSGLFGQPTVVNNVETLVNVLPIVLHGAAAYVRVGTKQSTGSRLFCMSGDVARPGVLEVPSGTTLRALIELAGGVPGGRPLQAVLLGGAAGTVLRPDELDLPLTLEDARAAGTTLGSGVVMLFDDTADLKSLLGRVASFFRDESCGQCVPCRVGTVRQEEALARIASGCTRGGVAAELALLDEVGEAMRDASICGLGQTAYAAVESAIKHLKVFGDHAPRASHAPATSVAPPAAAPVTTATLPPAAPATPGAAVAGAAPAASASTSASDRKVALSIDGRAVAVTPGTTILGACRELGLDVPTLCYLETLAPANACRLCVVEVEGARVLAPSCSRAVEPGMKVHTQSPRVRHSRKLVLELLASSVDLSTAPGLAELIDEYGAQPGRFGPAAAPTTCRDHALPGHHAHADPTFAANVHQPVKIDNELYTRDYAKCVLCYKCVEACGEDHQNSFAIAVAGRGFDARISTEFNAPLTDSACVYCGNCIAVCPTGALMAKDEFDLRRLGNWDESRQTETDTICPYCGVGCGLRLHVQDGRIVKATSGLDNAITLGNLCIKGRFGWRFVHPDPAAPR